MPLSVLKHTQSLITNPNQLVRTCTEMAEIFTLLIVFALYFPISIVKANDLPPDFYQVDYKSSDFPTQLKGFYRKEDYTHNEKTVYKKPRRDNYLYVDEDDKWTVGTKWTRDTNEDRIAMANEGYDLPESGEWEGLISGREDEHDLDVSVTEYKPEYPDYYQVTSSMEDLEGYYEKLPESQNLQKFPVFRKEIQGKQTQSVKVCFLFCIALNEYKASIKTSQ